MKTVNKKVFYCDHCNKHGLSKHAMSWHEIHCTKDPENIPACYECVHLKTDYIDIGGVVRGPQYFYCAAMKSQKMHNIVALRKKLPDKHPESFEDSVLMPVSCPLFKQNTEFKQLEADTFL